MERVWYEDRIFRCFAISHDEIERHEENKEKNDEDDDLSERGTRTGISSWKDE